MKLISLLEKLEYTCLQGSTDQEVKNVIYDSRKVEEGSLFICIRGAVVDGHKFVPDVVAKGAKVLIVEEAVEAPDVLNPITYCAKVAFAKLNAPSGDTYTPDR